MEDNNDHKPGLFGHKEFDEKEREVIQDLLMKKLPRSDLSTRPGGSGTSYTYVEGWKVIEIANKIFGFNGWSSSIINVTPDFVEENQKGLTVVGVTAVVKITLKDGTYHEDLGYGISHNSNKAIAIENAKKEAVTDATKRALRLFGNSLGNCIYDKDHLKRVKNAPQDRKGLYVSLNEDQIRPKKGDSSINNNNDGNFDPNTSSNNNQTNIPSNNQNNVNINTNISPQNKAIKSPQGNPVPNRSNSQNQNSTTIDESDFGDLDQKQSFSSPPQSIKQENPNNKRPNWNMNQNGNPENPPNDIIDDSPTKKIKVAPPNLSTNQNNNPTNPQMHQNNNAPVNPHNNQINNNPNNTNPNNQNRMPPNQNNPQMHQNNNAPVNPHNNQINNNPNNTNPNNQNRMPPIQNNPAKASFAKKVPNKQAPPMKNNTNMMNLNNNTN